MTDKPSNPTAEAMKKALAAKKAGGGPAHGGPAHGGLEGGARAEQKAQQTRNLALSKPAFRKASKRG
ncbi:MAG: hypothetical protein SWI22_10610 [Pseudomonadota bacterium]|nr:hypothetical protein [Pseudomonadota bacterium]